MDTCLLYFPPKLIHPFSHPFPFDRGGVGSEVKFTQIEQICIDSKGNILVAEQWKTCIRRINPEDGRVKTIEVNPRKEKRYQSVGVSTIPFVSPFFS